MAGNAELKDMEPLTEAPEYIYLSAIATDNLPNRSGMRIPAKELIPLAQFLVGKLAIKDHAMYRIDSGWGRISETSVEKKPVPKGLSKVDKAAIAAEGYQVVMCVIQVPADSDTLDAITQRTAGELSITFSYSQLKCPDCDCGKDIYPSWGCPRSVSNQPWLERLGVMDAYEISLVVVPAVKAARVLI